MSPRSLDPPPILDSETLKPISPPKRKNVQNVQNANDLDPRAETFLRQLRAVFKILNLFHR